MHICSPWRCSWSRHKSQDMSQDVTYLQFYTVVRRARGARTDTSKIENNKTHTLHTANNRTLVAVIPHLQDST